MGFYVRKAIRLGPLRFNLSTSGVGVSAGIRGFRVGMSPRGNYVHMGRGGLYYRATIPGGSGRGGARNALGAPPLPSSSSGATMTEIESASAGTIVDASSAELVAEMNGKRKKIRLWPFVLAAGFVLTSYVGGYTSAPHWTWKAMFWTTLIFVFAAAFYDRLRKTTILMYELDDEVERRYRQLHEAFEALGSCGGKWHIEASGGVRDRKYHAGASSVVRRSNIAIRAGQPPYVKANIPAPAVPVGRQTLYFFPDMVLVFEPNAVGAVSYENLIVRCRPTQFIEDGRVPKDAQVVDRTWRYVNRDGGPDRRFKDNRQLPVVQYDEISFTSDTGLNEIVQVSRTDVGRQVVAAIQGMAQRPR